MAVAMRFRLVLAAIILSGFGSTALGQEAAKEYPRLRDYRHPYKIEEKYDKFRDDTALWLRYETMYYGNKYDLELNVIRHSPGRKRTKGGVDFYFCNDSRDGWKYLKYHTVIFLVDGERWNFEPDHDGDVEDGYVLEHMFVHMSESRLLQLANAMRVEIKVGADSFPFREPAMEAIRDFASLIANPEAPIPDRPAEVKANPKKKKR